ncbi:MULTISPECIES: guanylate kinase [Nitrosomonas]|uniref:Guanylate kinase n=1 Tax=Nitrosomonas communis TaxID=44574 RepID=A0A0F7KJ53_9PROT|nr:MULTISPECIES: guanylate kinase [Nitrosomonas]AKH38827.1 guanylate kinase [Nitrosomonas communis]TYP79894.1 guanylate kinase [Nitrosomonas communis]UVS60938.1 guanylate kinase [Nitrosomonas sp. PLL12]
MSSLFIISAPSGAGKTSLIKALLQTRMGLSLSISHTTRQPRPNEINGQDYFFIDRDIFNQMLERGEFLESAEVYGNLYGTSHHWVKETMASGQDVLMEIDCQGTQQVRQIFPEAVSIFILPPSLESLKARLQQRGQDDPVAIARRLKAVREEVGQVNKFDYAVVNNELDKALKDICCIIRAERLRMMHQLVKQHTLLAQFA